MRSLPILLASGAGRLLKPFIQLVTAPPQQWYPLIIHFPIVCLIFEAALLVVFLFQKRPDIEAKAFTLLKLGWWSLLIAAAAGIHDAGLNLGPGNRFVLGLQDRWDNLFRFESSITVHVWLAGLLLGVTLCRLFWRWRRGPHVWQGLAGYWYSGLTGFGIWCLFAMSYVGGLISHR